MNEEQKGKRKIMLEMKKGTSLQNLYIKITVYRNM